MRKFRNFFSIVIICCSGSCYSQVKEFTAKEIQNAMARVNDTLYSSRYETTNDEYINFLREIANKKPSLYKEYYPDTAQWLFTGFNNDPMAEYYHRHPGFKNYPVVCISYEGAMAYCDWLTDIYNNDRERRFKKVVFVLPSEAEWEMAAMGEKKESVYPWGTNSMRETRKGPWQGSFLANYKRVGDGSIITGPDGIPVFRPEGQEPEAATGGLNERSFFTASVNSFFPNNLGIYNQGGNVAEMTSQKTLTKGGSWNSFGGELKIAYRLFFYEPSPEVGFRVFMKIIEQ